MLTNLKICKQRHTWKPGILHYISCRSPGVDMLITVGSFSVSSAHLHLLVGTEPKQLLNRSPPIKDDDDDDSYHCYLSLLCQTLC